MKLPAVLTVSQLNTYIKLLLDGDAHLSNVYVAGELSNFKEHSSGHCYFTLKDENATLKAVMFRSAAQKIRFKPENGLRVITRGRVSVYERDGQYQLYVDDMQPDGIGALNLAFEQLKQKLNAEGLFAPERKKPVPMFPQRVGVVTSPTGAALRDIVNVITRRFPAAQIVLCPVQVQGEQAAGQIAGAIRRFNKGAFADVLIVGRGGGSIEDLWAFNEEIVARAVAVSEIPVISAVGHETDYTICDFAADLRAPTPSAAAELAVPSRIQQKEYLKNISVRSSEAVRGKILIQRQIIKHLSDSPALSSPLAALDAHRQRLDSLSAQLTVFTQDSVRSKRSCFMPLLGKLDALSPLRVLARGYAIATCGGKALLDSKQVSPGSEVELKLSKGTLTCLVENVID